MKNFDNIIPLIVYSQHYVHISYILYDIVNQIVIVYDEIIDKFRYREFYQKVDWNEKKLYYISFKLNLEEYDYKNANYIFNNNIHLNSLTDIISIIQLILRKRKINNLLN